ncbi:hypothetical protein ACRC6Q_09625 [Planococcus sp. SE5232]|uniref:hypothetical protein n=1 Tax=unclassified Planococcus (in: firmicutes) TaxID=2662419 RepID=UPI001CBB948F|nr:hypothetical protein [Planococcus sp. 4-30]
MKKLILPVSLLLILSGCVNSDRYEFSGSSENWDVFYVVEILDRDRQQEKGTVKFTGDDDAPEVIEYRLQTTSGDSEGTGVMLTNGVGNIANGSCGGCAVVQEDEKVEVEITWDGQTEKLVLMNEN